MAIIKCPECGKEVSDKASSCPHCGNPLNKPEEEFLCCPKCGSKDLFTTEKGFSGLKAAAGFVAVGAIGTLMGTHGSKDILFTCKKCGKTFKFEEAKRIHSAAIVNGKADPYRNNYSTTSNNKEIILDDKLKQRLQELISSNQIYEAVDLYQKEVNPDLHQALIAITSIRLEMKKVDTGLEMKKVDTGPSLGFLIYLLVLIIIVAIIICLASK